MSLTSDHEEMLLCCMCRMLLQQPMQLNCLHNCCLPCLDNFVGAGVHKPVACPLCTHVTDVPPKDVNTFIARLTKISVASGDMSNCSVCVEEGRPVESAEVWCGQCHKSLCADCLRGHCRYMTQHVTMPLEAVGDSCSLPIVSAPQCQVHAMVLDHVCLTCAVPQCVDCGLSCARANHKVRLLGSPESDALVLKIEQDMHDLRRSLEFKVDTIKKRKNLVSDLKTARAVHIHELEKRKRVLLDAIDDAFTGAKAAIHDSYDILDEKASELAKSAEQLDDNVGLALKYSHILVDAGGAVNLLKQQRILLSRLQSLAKEIEQAQAPLDASKYVIIDSTQSGGLGELIKARIGTPLLLTDDLFCSADHALKCEARQRSRAQTSECSQPQHGEQGSEDTASELPELGPASTTFQSPAECCDVAVSSDGGRLLLASMSSACWSVTECGRGAELSRWRPAEETATGGDEWVTAVEALQDGRVAVGLYYSGCVALLRRAPARAASWVEDKRIITGLQVGAGLLSVHADLVAVAGWSGRPVPRLLLLSLSSGRELSRQQRQYRIGGVTVTAEAVLTASCGRVKLSDRREGWVVDAYSHDSQQLLWRQEQEHSVTDICAALSGRTLYLALEKSDSCQSEGQQRDKGHAEQWQPWFKESSDGVDGWQRTAHRGSCVEQWQKDSDSVQGQAKTVRPGSCTYLTTTKGSLGAIR